MKRLLQFLLLFSITVVNGQKDEWERKFEQLGTLLPTPNNYRNAAGAPGPEYWQMQADYDIRVELDDNRQIIMGTETITYHNNSPSDLEYLWVQLDQNMRASDSDTWKANSTDFENYEKERGRVDTISTTELRQISGKYNYDGGFKIEGVSDIGGSPLNYTINKTMMRIEMPTALESGSSYSFNIEWWYNINNRADVGGRSGAEYFPEDDNWIYAIAQFYPRVAVYNDVNGWQNKQFLGSGEFALTFGNFKVSITVPDDHIVAATGELQNPGEVLTDRQIERLEKARTSDKPVLVVTEKEARKNERSKSGKRKTWIFSARNVRDFAFASSRKFIWDAMGVQIGNKRPLAMSFYPREGNPLWEMESTWAVAKTLITYSKYTIDYPYPVAISVHTASIGMEYPMICFNFGRPNPDGSYTERTKYRMIDVIIHEIGHNFFPMIINSDERQWTWMDEGLNSFVQYRTQEEQFDNFPSRRGPPEKIIPYMKGDKSFIRPVMTNSEQILQFGNNAYAKPATALSILRETVMGPELFDYAFKEYARRWAFKHPEPADFFRTMEDASAVDLDWFWRGWFYSVDHVDIDLVSVRWFRIKSDQKEFEKRVQSGEERVLSQREDESYQATDFSGGFEELYLKDAESRGEFRSAVPNNEIKRIHADLNFYELTFKNAGGLVMPIIIEWTYEDGSIEIEKIPAEIWRMNEHEVKKVFAKEKEVVNITIDPRQETADVNPENNHFPKREVKSRFEKFKEDE